MQLKRRYHYKASHKSIVTMKIRTLLNQKASANTKHTLQRWVEKHSHFRSAKKKISTKTAGLHIYMRILLPRNWKCQLALHYITKCIETTMNACFHEFEAISKVILNFHAFPATNWLFLNSQIVYSSLILNLQTAWRINSKLAWNKKDTIMYFLCILQTNKPFFFMKRFA